MEEKNNEIEMKRIKLLIQNSEYGRRYENLQMANEDEISKVIRTKTKYDKELYKARYQTEHRSQSQVLSSEEENIDS